MKQIIMLGIGIMIIIFIGGGCMKGTQKRNKQAQIREDMKVYLKEKYGEEFEAVESSLVYADWAYPSDEMQAYPINDPDKIFLVHRGGDYDIGYSWSDSYFGKLIQPAYEEKAKEITNEYFEEYKLYVTLDNAVYSNELDKNATLEDMLNLENAMFTNSADIKIYILPGKQTTEMLTELLESYAIRLKNEKMISDVEVYVFREKSMYERMDRILVEEVYNQGETWNYERLSFSITKKLKIMPIYFMPSIDFEAMGEE